jgi:N-dimethylarginine dimethylaminohydrolase
VSVEPKVCGYESMTGDLRRVLVRAPSDLQGWQECGWRAEPDAAAIGREHEALCAILERAGAEVVLAESPSENADAVYVFDPALVGERGAILLNPGKELRRAEPAALAQDFERVGVPVTGRLEVDEWAEGGDLIRLDEHTLLAGRGYRTNDTGLARLSELLPDVEVVVFDLPHWHGAGEVMHLLSLLSPLAPDLAVAYPPLLPTRLAQLLDERGIEIVAVPDEEFVTMGSNVLALAPRAALAVEGNPETRRRLERAGVEVEVYEGAELSKGDGGPTCLTSPLLRV